MLERTFGRLQNKSASAHTLGFVFLDVTRLLEPRYAFIMHWRQSHGFVTAKMLAFAHTEYAGVFDMPNDGVVRGVVLRVAFPFLSQGLRLGTHETWHAVAVPGVDGSELNTFLRGFLGGLQGT